MEPGVPFALLGAVVLLAAAAWAALVGAAAVLRGSRIGAALVALGGLLLIGLEARVATQLGSSGTDELAAARAAGLLLLGAGLFSGALAHRDRRSPSIEPGAAAGVVIVPLQTTTGTAALGVAAGVVAAAGALRSRRDLGGVLVALGLLTAGGSLAAGPRADTIGGAQLAIGLRGLGAVLVLGGLLALARNSLLAKVVAAILAGVLATALVAVGVVGTTVVRGYEREQATLVADAAEGRLQQIQQTLERLRGLTPLLAEGCLREPRLCRGVMERLAGSQPADFALLVAPGEGEQQLAGRPVLQPSEALGLAGGALVREAAAGGPTAARGVVARVVELAGPEPGLAVAAALPLRRPTPTDPAPAVFVYGVRLDKRFVDVDLRTGGFGVAVVVAGQVYASNRPDRDEVVEQIAAESGTLPDDGVTVAAEGLRPTVHLRPIGDLGDSSGVIALSRGAEQALGSQRAALTILLLTLLGATGLIGILALLLGRQTVEPVRRLTAAARRVAAGDLGTSTGVSGRDEVGTLAGAFDTMTGSLARLTGDLRESATRLETVLASMSDGLLATDAEGRVTSVNRAALLMTGHPEPRDVLGRPLADVVDLRLATGAQVPVAVSDHLDDEPAEVHAADGAVTPVRAASAPLDAGAGPGGGVVLVLRDTTREREVERMKTEFLSNVSHELRTPLTPIRGYADLLSSRRLKPDQVSTFAGTILSESIKMNRVVDLLVDVAALEAGRVEIRPRSVDVRSLLDSRVAEWRERAPERADDLRRRAAGGLPPVLVDPTWLAKVLDELVDNAVKHTPRGTSITLAAAAAPDGDAVRLSVRDTGPGIAADEAELLFTSFEQRDGSATRRVGGLGLGLSFVRRVADDEGWPLTLISTPGKGAEFALDVPASDEPPLRPAPRKTASRPRKAKA